MREPSGRRRGSALILIVGVCLAGTGCSNLSGAARYAAGRVEDSIRDDFHRGQYFAGAAHVVLAPLAFTAVLIGDPGARTQPPRDGSESVGTQGGH